MPHLSAVTCLMIDGIAAEGSDVGDAINPLVIRRNWGQVKTFAVGADDSYNLMLDFAFSLGQPHWLPQAPSGGCLNVTRGSRGGSRGAGT